MARFALTRLASLVGIHLGLSAVVFLLEAVMPADPGAGHGRGSSSSRSL
jgi:hypothetical protein